MSEDTTAPGAGAADPAAVAGGGAVPDPAALELADAVDSIGAVEGSATHDPRNDDDARPGAGASAEPVTG